MGQPLFFERGCSPQVFFLTHMSSEKTIGIYFAPADAKVCDALRRARRGEPVFCP